MFARFMRGLAMVRAGGAVLREHPKLAIFPVLSGLSVIALFWALIWAVFYGVAAAAFVVPLADTDEASADLIVNVAVYATVFVIWFLFSFVTIFFNAALTFCALQCFAGDRPSLRAGLMAAFRRTPQIAAWAVLSATVGLIIRAIQNLLERTPMIGDYFEVILGGAWAAVTYFVLPVLVIEGMGPIQALKASAATVRKTWGETAASAGGLGLMVTAALLPVYGGIALVEHFEVLSMVSARSGRFLVMAAVIYSLLVWIISSAMANIIRTAGYVYAVTGDAPGSMDADLMRTMFKKK